MAGKEKDREERLGDLLIRRKLIKPGQLDQAVQCQVLFGGRLGTNLLELGFIAVDKLRGLLEEKYQLKSVTRADLGSIPREVINLVPRSLAEKHQLIPVRMTGETMEVAMLDPWRESGINSLHEITALKIQPLIALELDLHWALEKYYAVKREARYVNLDRWLEHQRQPGTEARAKTAKKGEPLLPPRPDITAIEGVPKSLEDFWDRVGRAGHPDFLLPRVLADFNQAKSRDEIARVILDFSALLFQRVLLFVVNEDLLFGWDGRGEGIDNRIALAIMLPLSRRSVFKTVVEAGAYFLGPIPDSSINRRFLAALGPAWPKTALVLPVLIAGKVAVILYADMGDQQETAVKLPPLQTVLSAAGQAFQRLIVKSKADNPR
jgi:hypothetical protein